MPGAEPPHRVPVIFVASGLALFAARYFLPAESAHLGETLWIVALWLLLALLWALARLRLDLPVPRIDGADAAVWLLVTGHVVSAAAVLLTEGQQRAALNMLWEWVGIGVAVSLLRRWLPFDRHWQQGLTLMAAAGVVLSALGVWQNAVTFPAYRRQLEEYVRLEARQSDGRLTEPEQRRLQQLAGSLGAVATESDPVARFTLRQRLVASTEPLACFALANTLAGVLIVSLLLLLGAFEQRPADSHRIWWLLHMAAPALLVAYCLILTKSRTAWVGLIAGIAAWGAVTLRRSTGAQVRRVLIIGVLAAAALTVTAWWSGALDRLVLLEAPKSLRYRVEYWTAAWGVIRDHPVLGVGPGNFRQHSLRHRVPGSSEEVLDPHNFILDVWANGGLLALGGLLLVGAIAAARWWRTAIHPQAAGRSDRDVPSPGGVTGDPRILVLLCGAAGILLVLLNQWLIEFSADERLLALLIGWIAATLLLPMLRFPTAVQAAAGIALGVHLLGAGGIAMPVIAVTLLLLWCGPPARPADAGEPRPATRSIWADSGIVLATACGGVLCLVTGVIPVTLAGLYVSAGTDAVARRGDVAGARRFLELAVQADPLDPQPHVYLAQLERDAARRLPNPDAAYELAISHLRQASRLDPENPKTYWLQAQWELERLEQRTSPDVLEDALRMAEAAAQRDPQHSGVVTTLAQALDAAGRREDAQVAARRALALDDLNRERGHYDRLLSEAQRALLSRLAADASPPAGARLEDEGE